MAIAPRAVGTWAFAASGSVTPTLPTHVLSDMLLVRVAYKSSAIATCAASTATSGWNKLGEFHDGTTNSGNGTGSVGVAVFWKEALSAAETNPTISFSQTVTQVGHVAVSYQKDSGQAWVTPVGDGGGFLVSPVSATIQSHVSVTSGDMVDVFFGSRDDSAFTVPTFTQASVTFAAVTEYPATAGIDATGADGSYDGCYRLATAGTSSAALVATATLAATETGAAWQTRLRQETPPPKNIDAGLINQTATISDPIVATVDKQLWLVDSTNTTSRFRWNGGQAYLRLSDATAIGVDVRLFRDTRGSGVGTLNISTVNGPTNGLEHVVTASQPLLWMAQVGENITISGPITFNLWASESSASANAGINIRLLVGKTDGSIVEVHKTANPTENFLTTSTNVRWSEVPTPFDILKGERLFAIAFADDAGGTMATGFTSSLYYSGTTADVSGDSWVGFTETFTTPTTAVPAGTDMYLTNTASTVDQGVVEKVLSLSRGSGVTTLATALVAGPTTGVQVDDGGAVAWYTGTLGAVTLSGPISFNITCRETLATGDAILRAEIAICDTDGGNPVVWGTNGYGAGGVELSTTEAAAIFWIMAPDVAVAAGQRIRVRLFFDDVYRATTLAMAASGNGEVMFGATTGGGSGDAFMTFTQTITEIVPQDRPPVSRVYAQILAH